jgi:hypothetical protein
VIRNTEDALVDGMMGAVKYPGPDWFIIVNLVSPVSSGLVEGTIVVGNGTFILVGGVVVVEGSVVVWVRDFLRLCNKKNTTARMMRTTIMTAVTAPPTTADFVDLFNDDDDIDEGNVAEGTAKLGLLKINEILSRISNERNPLSGYRHERACRIRGGGSNHCLARISDVLAKQTHCWEKVSVKDSGNSVYDWNSVVLYATAE